MCPDNPQQGMRKQRQNLLSPFPPLSMNSTEAGDGGSWGHRERDGESTLRHRP